MTKVLQNLANDVEFGAKESYMTKMNDFIQTNRGKLVDFYTNLLKGDLGNKTPVNLPKGVKGHSLNTIAGHLKDNIAKITDTKLQAKLKEILN